MVARLELKERWFHIEKAIIEFANSFVEKPASRRSDSKVASSAPWLSHVD